MTSKVYGTDMAKDRLTVYLAPEVARALRVSAARRGLKDSEVVEEALRDKLLFTALERSAALNADLGPEEALELVVRIQHETRERRQRAAS